MRSVLLRTIAAVLRAGADDSEKLDVQGEFEDVDRELAMLPSERPMSTLARRLSWSALETDFVWATIALATDPRLLVYARVLDPSAAQGMSMALYSRIARLDAVDSLVTLRTRLNLTRFSTDLVMRFRTPLFCFSERILASTPCSVERSSAAISPSAPSSPVFCLFGDSVDQRWIAGSRHVVGTVVPQLADAAAAAARPLGVLG